MSYFKNTPESLLEKVKEIQIKTAAREGNKFTKALMAARENGNKFFTVNGKEYETEALDDKDFKVITKLIKSVVADVLRDIWLKRNVWK